MRPQIFTHYDTRTQKLPNDNTPMNVQEKMSQEMGLSDGFQIIIHFDIGL